MSAINPVQQGLLNQLQQLSQIAEGEAIKPAMQLPASQGHHSACHLVAARDGVPDGVG